jgi:type II secretory pathway pseudopilin PulG
MVARTGLKQLNAGAGFTLVELLLAVVLVLLLIGAMVFNFSGLQRGAALEEGARQVEALLRFARAESANCGKPIQLIVPVGDAGGTSNSTSGLHLVWEPDPIASPGTFVTMPGAGEFLRGLNDLIRVERVRLGPPPQIERESSDPATSAVPPGSAAGGASTDRDGPDAAEVIVNFYPDGSSDSAELLLASSSTEDLRKIVIQLMGVTGTVRRRRLEPESDHGADLAANDLTRTPGSVENSPMVTSNRISARPR